MQPVPSLGTFLLILTDVLYALPLQLYFIRFTVIATFPFPVFIIFYVTHRPFGAGILVYACHKNKIFLHSFISMN